MFGRNINYVLYMVVKLNISSTVLNEFTSFQNENKFNKIVPFGRKTLNITTEFMIYI